MNKAILKSAALAVALGSVLTLGACTAEKTQEGELPDVDVSAEGGQLPAYEVETADVEVGTKQTEVTVPDVDVTMPDEKDAAEQAPAEPAPAQ